MDLSSPKIEAFFLSKGGSIRGKLIQLGWGTLGTNGQITNSNGSIPISLRG